MGINHFNNEEMKLSFCRHKFRKKHAGKMQKVRPLLRESKPKQNGSGLDSLTLLFKQESRIRRFLK